MQLSIFRRGRQRIKRSWDKYQFDRTAVGVLKTSPLLLTGDSPLFLSMVCHKDVLPYLLAVKSLYSRVGHGRVLAINDGSLSPSDISILREHIPSIELLDIQQIDTAGCPRGGTWERLVKIIELTKGTYVIQVDADTLVSAPIPEVVKCWRENRSFLLGTDSGQTVAPVAYSAEFARKSQREFNHFCYVAEGLLDVLPETRSRYYVRGSSGFAGFAKGAFNSSDLSTFSGVMRAALGERWDDWGSEQISSNYILANAPQAVVLPLDRYTCFEPKLLTSDAPFLHFYGPHRYYGGVYRKRVQFFLTELSRGFRGGMSAEEAFVSN